jgi:hypothetical protein
MGRDEEHRESVREDGGKLIRLVAQVRTGYGQLKILGRTARVDRKGFPLLIPAGLFRRKFFTT